MKAPSVRPVRCAVYTRVSTEHGLDQEFNSLDAQYEAASAYIKSQAHAGWTAKQGKSTTGAVRLGDRGTLAQLMRTELTPGTVLVREWDRRSQRVMVMPDGFAWNGQTYDSLSKVAFAITGTKWNGPRFFGLRDKEDRLDPKRRPRALRSRRKRT